MGTTALRPFLKCLCNNSPWKYAVFWKLNHQSDLILAWEDGYCHHPEPRETVECAPDDIYFSHANHMLLDGESACYPFGVTVADMSQIQHTYGKGVVGEVAFTGNHSWVFLDSLCDREFDSKLVPEFPDGWFLQFALGIKTILLVPVLPYGVLQLGSLETVSEDLAVVASVKDRFISIHNVLQKTGPFTFINDIQAQLSSPQSSSLMESTLSTAGTINPLKVERSEDVFNIRLNDNLLSSLGQFVQFPTVEDSLLESGTNQPEVLKSTGENRICVPPVCHIGESSPLGQSIDASFLEMVGTPMFGLSSLEEEALAHSQYGGCNMEVFESFGGFNPYSAGGIAELFNDNTGKGTGYNVVNSFFSFPENCELHKALGTTFQRQGNEHVLDSSMSADDTCSSSSLQKNLVSGIEPSWFSQGAVAENPLDVLIAKDDTSSRRSDNIGSCVTSSNAFPASCKQLKSEASAPIGRSDSMAWNHTSTSFTGMMSTAVDKEQQGKGYASTQHKKDQKLSGANGRKSRLGNGPKQRPRDRQMIQDRVKELRELVPNGAKCSIDGLLDQTVKHMLYLRSMTDQAEKLKSYANQEVPRGNNMNEAKRGFQNGTSRAFEVGSELQICPIVVEDLEHPGHMLIEMLCDEHGLFLEIAQAIRRLEMTILKGVMETRSSNMRAHFVVEAPRGFHRMDVFWPLLHLLQRSRSSISSKI